MIEVLEIRDATKEEIQEYNRTCGTCIDNDDGLCDRRGVLVDDEDSCEKHRKNNWQQQMLRTFLGGR